MSPEEFEALRSQFATLNASEQPAGRGRHRKYLPYAFTEHGAIMADMWSARQLQQPQMWAPDRLHFSHFGHHEIAMLVLEALGVQHSLTHMEPEPLPAQTRQQMRMQDLHWAREHLAPWVVRRLRGQSSGDTISPKRPTPGPVLPFEHLDG